MISPEIKSSLKQLISETSQFLKERKSHTDHNLHTGKITAPQRISSKYEFYCLLVCWANIDMDYWSLLERELSEGEDLEVVLKQECKRLCRSRFPMRENYIGYAFVDENNYLVKLGSLKKCTGDHHPWRFLFIAYRRLLNQGKVFLAEELDCVVCSKILIQCNVSQVILVSNNCTNHQDNETTKTIEQLYLRSTTAYKQCLISQQNTYYYLVTNAMVSFPYDNEYVNSLSTKYHMGFGYLARLRSDDTKTYVGSVITKVLDSGEEIIGLGWNGYPKKSNWGDFPLTKDEGSYEYSIHAEQNALLFLFEEFNPNLNYRLYSTRLPCSECSPLLQDVQEKINFGLEIIYAAVRHDAGVVKDSYQDVFDLWGNHLYIRTRHCPFADPFDYQLHPTHELISGLELQYDNEELVQAQELLHKKAISNQVISDVLLAPPQRKREPIPINPDVSEPFTTPQIRPTPLPPTTSTKHQKSNHLLYAQTIIIGLIFTAVLYSNYKHNR
eukprot:TRINITY_DN12055_c0_g1_i1.p1 TRINITY_DN12055_c0_g1~~TRINITY_DN12055_c0_g1_i1.p1  ORF type:complete len:506 (-),score=74.56 TRINITY_DN12055_c0_g1_i1:16-1509(-)